MTTDPADRLRQIRDDMAAKSRLLMARGRYTDHNGHITPENQERALVDAGFKEPSPPPPEVSPEIRIARLEAAQRHDLTVEQADAMTSTTPDAIETEAKAMAPPIPPGDGGARKPVPPVDPITEAEKNGDWDTARRLKTQQLIDMSEARKALNHPNAPR